MIRPFTCVCMLLAGASGLYLYQAKHRAQLLDRQIAATMHQAEQTRDRSGVLRAQWMQLQDPERLAALAGRFLQLKTTQPPQFTNFAELDNRLPAIRVAPATAETTDEAASEPSAMPLATTEPVVAGTGAAQPASAAPPANAPVVAPPPVAAAPAAAPAHVAAVPHVARPNEPHAIEAHAEHRPARDFGSALGYARRLAAAGTPAPAPVPMVTAVATPLLVRSAPAYAPAQAAAPMPGPVVGSALGMARTLAPAPAPLAAPRDGN